MSESEFQYCSWCFQRTTHKLVKRNYLTRNEYQCNSCKNYTVQCRYCQNMATFKPINSSDDFFNVKENWASELCAEHDGTIADFTKLNKRINDLKDYASLFENSKLNLMKAGKIAGGMIAGAAVFCPIAYLAAPEIAAVLGSAGLIGSGITNTVITTLSGFGFSSAALAAISTEGVILISATGAALGAIEGGVISNNYFGAVKDFNIKKVKNGSGPALVFINGFLSQKNQDASDWLKAVNKKFPSNPCYYVNWESSSLYKMGSLVIKGAGGIAFQQFVKTIAKRGSKKLFQKLNPLSWASTIADLFGNPWHTAMVKSSMTGILLADLIARTNQPDGFILMGHSLGARVVHFLLHTLATKHNSSVKDVYLLGGATDRKDTKMWEAAVKSVEGKIYNCYSYNDNILKYLYTGANAILSSPIGTGNIELNNPKIKNINTSSIINGHMVYKENFSKILSHIH